MNNKEQVQLPVRWTARQVMLATVFVAAVVLAFWMLYRFRTVIFVLFVAILVGTAMRPAVNWFARRGVPNIYGIILTFLLMTVLVTAFVLMVLPLILEQGAALTDLLSGYYDRFRVFLLTSPSNILTRLGFSLSPDLEVETLVPPPEAPEEPAPEETPPAVDAVAQLFTYGGMITRILFMGIAILIMSFYWTLEGNRAIRTLLLLAPTGQRDNIREIIEAIETRLGGFLLGEVILGLSVGSLQLVAYLLIGLPNAVALAVIAGVMELIPTIGPLLGAIPAILVATTADPSLVIWVILSTSIVQFLENNLLVPRIMGKSVGVHPLLTLLALAAFSSLMGVAGALLAVPMAAIVQLLMDRFVLQAEEKTTTQASGRDYVSYLRLQAQEIAKDTRKQVRQKEQETEKESDRLEDAIEALANDLDQVLEQAARRENGAQ